MDLEAEYNRVERRLMQIEKALEKLEDEGLYGSKDYDALIEEETDLTLELHGIEEEMERD